MGFDVHQAAWKMLSTTFVCLALASGGAKLKAQASHFWTPAEVEERVLSASPSVRNAIAQLEVARSHRAFAKLPVVLNPIVGVRAMIGRPDAPAATYSTMLGLPFDVSGKRRAWSREANALIAESQAQLSVARNETLSHARRAYVLVASGEAALQVAQDSVANAADVLARVRARFEANAATLLDVALAEREHGEATADVARARHDWIDAAGQFRQVLDLPPSAALAIAPVAVPTPLDVSVERAVAEAKRRRPELAVLENGIERLQRSDTRLRKEVVGPLQLAAEGEAQGNQNTQSTGGASVSFELPVFFHNQGERAVAKGKAAALQVERELAEHAIARQAEVAVRTFEAALAELEAIEGQALLAADQALAMTTDLLAAGAVDYFYLLTARRSAFQLRARRVSSLRDAWLARIEVDRALGGWSDMGLARVKRNEEVP